jgi:long-chain acyl-CoA synthetase
VTTTPVTRIRDHAAQMPMRVALRAKSLGVWRETTWRDYWDQVQLVGHALLDLGLEVGDRVAIQSENRPEWLASDMGALAVRAPSVGIDPSSPAAEVQHVLSHSGAVVLIAEDQEQVDKALEVLAQCPDLRHIVYVEPRGIRNRYDHSALTSWDELLERGRRHRQDSPDAVTQRMAEALGSDVATVVYASHSADPPEGVVQSVDAVESALRRLVLEESFTSPPPGPSDLSVSYLPLSHVAERMLTTWFNAAAGTQVNFAESSDSIAARLREVQPTILFGVPRLWEELHAGVLTRVGDASWFKRKHAKFWMRRADRSSRLRYAIGWVVFFRPLRERLGLRHVRHASSGAAPIAPDVLRFFTGIGVPIHEVDGLTGNTVIATGNRPSDGLVESTYAGRSR